MTTPTPPELDGFEECHGVQVSVIGDDGNDLVLLGHHQPQVALAALTSYTRGLGYRDLLDYEGSGTHADLDEAAANLRQRWAVLATKCDDPDCGGVEECSYCRDINEAPWWLNCIDKDQPGAFPITVWSR